MYDHATKSFWSTLKGEPVVGPLVGKGIKLNRRYLVTTTWGEWKKRHPDTTVLSLDTGHDRDYGEGVAYHSYFATDKLMFKVPGKDDRLLNKDSVVALRDENSQLAIAAKFLAKNPVYSDKLGDQDFVVLTNGAGANRGATMDGPRRSFGCGRQVAAENAIAQRVLVRLGFSVSRNEVGKIGQQCKVKDGALFTQYLCPAFSQNNLSNR